MYLVYLPAEGCLSIVLVQNDKYHHEPMPIADQRAAAEAALTALGVDFTMGESYPYNPDTGGYAGDCYQHRLDVTVEGCRTKAQRERVMRAVNSILRHPPTYMPNVHPIWRDETAS